MIQLKMELFHHTTLENLLIFMHQLKPLALWNRTHQRQISVLDEQFILQAKTLGI
jgi:hypothetical protein